MRTLISSFLCASAVVMAVAVATAAFDEKLTDNAFLQKAVSAGLTEVKAGQMALQKATDAKVKTFAQRMIDDHSRANKELEALARRKGWVLPDTIDEKCQNELDKLASATMQEFDRKFIRGQIKAHEEAVKVFAEESQTGHDNDLKNWAAKTLPTLRDHLQMAKEAGEGKDGKTR
jgi:putative membrane protein